MVKYIDIAMTPAEAALLRPAECYLVIDVLRATTTIATLFERGLGRLTVVSTIEAARALSKPGILLFGEQGGLRPEGFDYGNSPVECASLELPGGEAALMTSNGTVALCALARRGVTAAASLANLSAVTAFAEMHHSVVVVCAGNGGARRFSLEDFAAAATVAQRIQAQHPVAELGDGAILASRLPAAAEMLQQSSHAAILRTLGLEDDIAYAAHQDTSAAVPVVTAFGEDWAILQDRRADG